MQSEAGRDIVLVLLVVVVDDDGWWAWGNGWFGFTDAARIETGEATPCKYPVF